MINMDVQNLEKDRLAFLVKLYEVGEGSRFSYHPMYTLGSLLGFEPNYTHKIVDYLVSEGFVTSTLGGGLAITHEGIKEAEALAKPHKQTAPVSPLNITQNTIQIGKMSNSTIQQSVKDSQQIHSVLSEEKKNEFRLAGVISLVIGVILWIIGFNAGWNQAGQIFGVFALVFSILGGGSLLKPELFGQMTAQLLRNIQESQRK